jgi:hypothetical protein
LGFTLACSVAVVSVTSAGVPAWIVGAGAVVKVPESVLVLAPSALVATTR